MNLNRFSSPSDRINRGRLLAETRRLVASGLLISMGFVGGAFIYFAVLPKEKEAPPPPVIMARITGGGPVARSGSFKVRKPKKEEPATPDLVD